MSGEFHFSQWNDPAWRAKQQALAKSDARPELPEAEVSAVPPEVSAAPAACKHCGSQNFTRMGFYRSQVLDELGERRQNVRCIACNRISTLAAGAVLLTKHKKSGEKLHRKMREHEAFYERTQGITDVRPNCPRCGGNRVQSRGRILRMVRVGGRMQRIAGEFTGKRCWHCVDCKRQFFADDSVAIIDHRKLPPRHEVGVLQWHEIPPKEEATFLFRFAKRNGGDFASMRMTIDVGEKERKDLDYLVADGVLPREEVDSALWYRAQVIEVFDELVQKERQCRQFLAESGLVAQTEGLLKSRDEMIRPFDNLVDQELAAMTPELEPKRDCETANLAMTERDNSVRSVITAGEEGAASSPVLVTKDTR